MSAVLSKSGMQVIDEGRQWAEDNTARLVMWAKVGWGLAGMFLVLFLMAMAVGFVVWLKMSVPVPPSVLAVDHATGEVQALEVFGQKVVSNLELVHKLSAKRYVEYCERYIPQMLNDDYAACQNMSEGDALAKYQKIYQGDDARNKKLRDQYTWTIDVLSVQLPSDAAGVAIVRFKKSIWQGGSLQGEGYFVARMSYRFLDIPKATMREKLSNTFGYKVKYYTSDPEIGVQSLPGGSTPAVAPNGDTLPVGIRPASVSVTTPPPANATAALNFGAAAR